MSLEDIDKKIEQIAQKQNRPVEKEKPVEEQTQDLKKTSYEETLKKNKVSGLLSIFENHLRKNQQAREQRIEESDTINLSSSNIVPSSVNQTDEEVSEEQIESLLTITKNNNKKTDFKNNTYIDDVVYTQTRYGDLHNIPENVASSEDIIPKETNKQFSQNINVTRYEDQHKKVENKPSVEDTKQGLPPVNKTVRTVDESGEVQHHVQNTISNEVLEHIESHRKKKKKTQISEHDKTNQNTDKSE